MNIGQLKLFVIIHVLISLNCIIIITMVMIKIINLNMFIIMMIIIKWKKLMIMKELGDLMTLCRKKEFSLNFNINK